MAITFSVELVSEKSITPNVKHFVFKRCADGPLSFIPGQFVSIHWPNGEKEVRRSYSIATIPGQSEFIEFAASYVAGGFASERLFTLKPGDKVMMSGPYGRLILRDEEQPKRIFLMATGTGVTPYRAMLPSLQQRISETATQIILLQGVQYRHDSLYLDDFLGFSTKNKKVDFRVYYSRDDLTDKKSHEFQGYVQHAFADFNPSPEEDIVYLCGNPHMIDDAFAELKTRGFEAQGVRREKYVS